MVKQFKDMFSHFGTVQEHDSQKDRHHAVS